MLKEPSWMTGTRKEWKKVWKKAELKAWKKACPSEALKLPGRCTGKGYGKNCKEFTPMQVSYILYFLGEP